MLRQTKDVAVIAGLIYFLQGALGISSIALLLYLRGLSWSVTEITAVNSIAAIPWLLKIAYGYVSDTYPLAGYRRKSYLIIYSLISALGWLGLALLPGEKNWILLSMVFTNIGFAATDVITDGLIVEHSTQQTSSVYQAIAWGSRSFGSVVSGFVGGWLAANCSPYTVFLITMLLPVTVFILALIIHERKVEDVPQNLPDGRLSQSVNIMTHSQLGHFAVVLFVMAISAAFGTPFFFYMRETLGFHQTFLGLLTSLGWSGALLGSIVYLRWLRKFSQKNILRWGIIANSLNVFAALFIHNEQTALIMVFMSGILGCLVMLPVMSSAAALTHHSGVEGTLFAILMSIFNLGQIFFGYLGGRAFAVIGLIPLILITGVLALSALFFTERLKFASPTENPV